MHLEAGAQSSLNPVKPGFELCVLGTTALGEAEWKDESFGAGPPGSQQAPVAPGCALEGLCAPSTDTMNSRAKPRQRPPGRRTWSQSLSVFPRQTPATGPSWRNDRAARPMRLSLSSEAELGAPAQVGIAALIDRREPSATPTRQ